MTEEGMQKGPADEAIEAARTFMRQKELADREYDAMRNASIIVAMRMGATMTDIAKALGVTRPTIANWSKEPLPKLQDS